MTRDTAGVAPTASWPRRRSIFDRQRQLRYVGRIDDSEVSYVARHPAMLLMLLLAESRSPWSGLAFRLFDEVVRQARMRQTLQKWDQEPVTLETLDGRGRPARENEGDKLLLVNVWATWCGPCVTELPEFVTMNRMYRRREFKLITLSLDEPEKKDTALKILKEQHVAMANYIVNVKNRDKFADLLDKEWAGPLPHTLLIAPGGKILYRKTGGMDPLELKRAIVGYLGRTYASKKSPQK